MKNDRIYLVTYYKDPSNSWRPT